MMGPALLAVTSLWLAQTPPKSIASPTWKTVQVSPELAAFFSDTVAGALRKHGFRVMTASEIEALLSGERQKALMGCTDEATNCIAELAAALGCDATLLVTLAKLDQTYRGNLKVLSSVNGDVLSEVQVEANGDNALARELEAAAGRLAAGLDPKHTLAPAATVKAGGGSKRFWLVPAISGAAIAAIGGIAFIFSESTYARLENELRAGNAISAGDASNGSLAQSLGWVAVGIGAAAIAVGAGLLLFGSEPAVTPVVSFGPGGAAFGLAGTWP